MKNTVRNKLPVIIVASVIRLLKMNGRTFEEKQGICLLSNDLPYVGDNERIRQTRVLSLVFVQKFSPRNTLCGFRDR